MTRKTLLTLGAAAAAVLIAATAIAHDGRQDGTGQRHMMRGDHAEAMQDGRGHGPRMRRGAGGPMGMERMADSPIFGAFDTDGDGAVTPAEAETGLAGLLDTHDADGDGTLSRAEFDALFADATRHRADRPFAMLDADENGRIDAAEIRFPAEMMARMQRMHDSAPDAQ